uniref:C2H2-type domain-containing protein n=1 Tax=Nothobranchius kadleci TaxID=1051664 RepID=A0A1A8BAA9_NOTKA
MSDPHERRRQVRHGQEAGAAKKPVHPHQTQTSSSRRMSRSGSQDGDENISRTISGPPELVTDGRRAGEDTRKQSAQVQRGMEDESDDSDVSEICDDEEEDEEDEEELSNEPSISGDYQCSVCDLHLSSKFKLQDHMNMHTGTRPYCCAECGKRFCQTYNYRVHLRTHAKVKVKRVWCRICLLQFSSQEQLTHHLSRAHQEDVFYECDLCKRVFTSLKDCQNHVLLRECMRLACEQCERSFRSEKSLARHKKRCLRTFKCTDCSQTFAEKNALLKHSFSHLGLLPYTCLRCRCHFRLAKLYRQHKCEPERIHCVACLREFLSQEDFQQHKKDTGCWGNQELHQKPNEIRCLECGQRFETSEELKKHAGAHQRVLKCAECGKGFRSALLLMSHMGGHAGQSPCFCQRCGLGFPYQQNYDSHLKTCGKTPQSESVPKKRQAPKNSPVQKILPTEPKPESTSSSDTVAVSVPKKRRAFKNPPPKKTLPITPRPESTSSSDTVTVSDPVSTSPAAPGRDSCSPGSRTDGMSACSSSSDGLWTLTLDEKSPPAVNLVLFVPVCPNGELPLPSAVQQSLPLTAVQALPQASTSELLGANATVGVPLNPPFELLTGFLEDSEGQLDLSKKCESPAAAESNAPLLAVKTEPMELEISGQAGCSDKHEGKGHGSGEMRCFKTEPAMFSALSAQTEPTLNQQRS